MLDTDYVLGLVDGEGCFAVHLNRSPLRRARVEPHFCLKLKAEDRELLDEVRNFFGCGKVYIQRDKRPNHSLCYRFEVNNWDELWNIIVPFFVQHPLHSPSKRRDFEVFRQIMLLIQEDKHLSDEGLQAMSELKARMH